VPGYGELTKAYLFTEKQLGGSTGVRVFVKDGGAQDLPELGDEHPDDSTCLLRTRVHKLYGGKEGLDHWTLNYSTDAPEDSRITETTPFEQLPRRFSQSGEFLRIDDGRNYNWDGTSDPTRVAIAKHIVTGTMTIPRVFKTFEKLLDTVRPCQDSVNNKPFLGQAVELWRYAGCDSTEYFNSVGSKRWRADLSFELRSIAQNNTFVGWQHVYDPVANEWKKTDPLIYTNLKDFRRALF